jgi:hypothetical protein
MRHYLVTTEEHFAAAVTGTKETAQNAAQQANAGSRVEPHLAGSTRQKPPALPGSASRSESTLQLEMAVARCVTRRIVKVAFWAFFRRAA